MRARSLDLYVVAAVAVVALGVALIGERAGPLRAAPAAPLVLFCPGYAVMAALFPSGGARLGMIERAVLSVGLSLVLGGFVGLLLNLTPVGLHGGAWAVLLSAIVLVANVVALYRRRSAVATTSAWGGLHLRQGLLLAGSCLLVVGALVVARQGAEGQAGAARFTQLWLLPAGENGRDADTLRLGVRSVEGRPTIYLLRVTVGGTPVQEWPAIEVASGAAWETSIVLPRSASGDGARGGDIEAVLSRAEAPETPYRRVLLRRSRDAGAEPSAAAADAQSAGEGP